MDPDKRERRDAMGNGLLVHREGLSGLYFETTASHMSAVARHATLVAAFDSTHIDLTHGARFLLSLLVNDGCITLNDLKAATSHEADLYEEDENVYLEWPRGDGWIGRLILSETSKQVGFLNNGCLVRKTDWRDAQKWIADIFQKTQNHYSWNQVIGDAQAWWYPHLNGPIFAHLLGLLPLQPLPRAAIARRASKLPQKAGDLNRSIEERDRVSFLIQTARSQTIQMQSIESLKEEVGYISRRKQSKEKGREEILDYIERIMLMAAAEGKAQVFVLAGIHHCVQAGGIRGELLAPATWYGYMLHVVVPLTLELSKVDVESVEGVEWHAKYSRLIDAAIESQKPKLRAFLEVFHRYLVILGAEPLPRSLGKNRKAIPPNSTVVWPHELERAVEFIHCSTDSDRIKANAIFGLRLGYWVPMRISEFWNQRFGDWDVRSGVTVSILPRRRDGKSKTTALRRQEDVSDPELIRVALDIREQRRSEHALGEDVLLGMAGYPGERFEEQKTTELINRALRYATGDQTASFHDLRHTAFSRRSEPVLAGVDETSDAGLMMGISCQGGHAGPSSSAAYQHWVEMPIAEQAKSARPLSWNASQDTARPKFGNVADGLVTDIACLMPAKPRPKPLEACDLSIKERAEILFRVAKKQPLECAEAVRYVGMQVVFDVIDETAKALEWCKLATHDQIETKRMRLGLIEDHYFWARASKQPKHHSLVSAIQSDLDQRKFKELNSLWAAWERCADGNHLSVDNPEPARHFISYLLRAGVKKTSILIVRAADAKPLQKHIAEFCLEELPVISRDGRASNRLQISGPGIRARETEAAGLSMVGFHWWMLCLRAALISKGEA